MILIWYHYAVVKIFFKSIPIIHEPDFMYFYNIAIGDIPEFKKTVLVSKVSVD